MWVEIERVVISDRCRKVILVIAVGVATRTHRCVSELSFHYIERSEKREWHQMLPLDGCQERFSVGDVTQQANGKGRQRCSWREFDRGKIVKLRPKFPMVSSRVGVEPQREKCFHFKGE